MRAEVLLCILCTLAVFPHWLQRSSSVVRATVIVDLNATNSFFSMVNESFTSLPPVLEVHVCREQPSASTIHTNHTTCDPGTTNISLVIENVTFPPGFLVHVFGYAPRGHFAVGAACPASPADDSYVFDDPCPYYSGTFRVGVAIIAGGGTLVINGSFCNSNMVLVGLRGTSADRSSIGTADVLLHNLLFRQTTLTAAYVALGVLSISGSSWILSDDSTAMLQHVLLSGFPNNSTAELLGPSSIVYEWWSVPGRRSPSFIAEVSDCLVLTNRSILAFQDASLGHGTAVLFSRPSTTASTTTALPPPCVLISYSSSIVFEYAMMGNMSADPSYNFIPAFTLGPSAMFSGGTGMVPADITIADNSSLTFRESLLMSTTVEASAALFIFLGHMVEDGVAASGALVMRSGGQLRIEECNVVAMGGAVIFDLWNTTRGRLLFIANSGVLIRASNITSYSSIGIYFDVSASKGTSVMLSGSSFVHISEKSAVRGTTMGLIFSMEESLNCTFVVDDGSSVSVRSHSLVQATSVRNAFGVLIYGELSTSLSFTLSTRSFVGAEDGGRVVGAMHGLVLHLGSSVLANVTLVNHSMFGVRRGGVVVVEVGAALAATSAISTFFAGSTDGRFTLRSASLFGVLGGFASMVSTAVTITPSTPPATVGLSASAALDLVASNTTGLVVSLDQESVIGVVSAEFVNISLGEHPLAGVVSANFEDSSGGQLILLRSSVLGIAATSMMESIAGFNTTAPGHQGGPFLVISSRSSTVAVLGALSLSWTITVASGSVLGICGDDRVSTVSRGGNGLVLNFTQSANTRIVVFSGAIVGVRIGTSSVASSRFANVSSQMDLVMVSLPMSTNSSVYIAGGASVIGIGEPRPAAASLEGGVTYVASTTVLVRLDMNDGTDASLIVVDGGLFGIRLVHQPLRAVYHWAYVGANRSTRTEVVVQGTGSLIGVTDVRFAAAVGSRYGGVAFSFLCSLSRRAAVSVQSGGALGVLNVSTDSDISGNAVVFAFSIDSSNETVILCSGLGSLVGVGERTNVRILNGATGSTFSVIGREARNALLIVTAGATVGLHLVNSTSRMHFLCVLVASQNCSLIVSGIGSTLGTSRTIMQPFGSCSLSIASSVNNTIAITSGGVLGLGNGSILDVPAPAKSVDGWFVDVRQSVNASLSFSEGACGGCCDGSVMTGNLDRTVTLWMVSAIMLTLRVDTGSVLGARGGSRITASSFLFLYVAESSSSSVVVSGGSVIGAANQCTISTSSSVNPAVMVTSTSSTLLHIAALAGGVIGVLNRSTVAAAHIGVYVVGNNDTATLIMIGGASVLGASGNSSLSCGVVGVAVYAVNAVRAQVVVTQESVIGVAGGSFVETFQQFTVYVYFFNAPNAQLSVHHHSTVGATGEGSRVVGCVRFEANTASTNVTVHLQRDGVIGATQNATIYGRFNVALLIYLENTVNVSFRIEERSVIGTRDGGVIFSNISTARYALFVSASYAVGLSMKVSGRSAVGVLPDCPFGPAPSVVLAEFPECVNAATIYRRAYLWAPEGLLILTFASTQGASLSVELLSLIGSTSLPWPQSADISDGCDSTSPPFSLTTTCPIVLNPAAYGLAITFTDSSYPSLHVSDGSCVGICVEARRPSADVHDAFLVEFLLTYARIHALWVFVTFMNAVNGQIQLRNGSSIGLHLENAFVDPASLLCNGSTKIQASAFSFLQLIAVDSRFLSICITENSSLQLSFRIDVGPVMFLGMRSMVSVNFTGSSDTYLSVDGRSAFLHVAQVVPQVPKQLLWPSPGCRNTTTVINATLSVTGLFGVTSSVVLWPLDASVIGLRMHHCSRMVLTLSNASCLLLFQAVPTLPPVSAVYRRNVSAPWWPTVYVAQGSVLLVDLLSSKDVALTAWNGSSVASISGSTIRAIAQNDGGMLFLALNASNVTINITTSVDAQDDGNAAKADSTVAQAVGLLSSSHLLSVRDGVKVLRQRNSIPVIAFLLCADPTGALEACTSDNIAIRVQGEAAHVITVEGEETFIDSGFIPIVPMVASITSDILLARNQSIPSILVVFPTTMGGLSSQQQHRWAMTVSDGAAAVSVQSGATVSGMPTINHKEEPVTLSIGMYCTKASPNSSGGGGVPPGGGAFFTIQDSSNVPHHIPTALLRLVAANIIGRIRLSCPTTADEVEGSGDAAAYAISGGGSSSLSTSFRGCPWVIFVWRTSMEVSMSGRDVASSVPFGPDPPNAGTAESVQRQAVVASYLSIDRARIVSNDTTTLGSIYLERAQIFVNQSSAEADPRAAILWWPQLLRALSLQGNSTYNKSLTTVELATICNRFNGSLIRTYNSTENLSPPTTGTAVYSSVGAVGYIPVPRSPPPAWEREGMGWKNLLCTETASPSLTGLSETHSSTVPSPTCPTSTQGEHSSESPSMQSASSSATGDTTASMTSLSSSSSQTLTDAASHTSSITAMSSRSATLSETAENSISSSPSVVLASRTASASLHPVPTSTVGPTLSPSAAATSSGAGESTSSSTRWTPSTTNARSSATLSATLELLPTHTGDVLTTSVTPRDEPPRVETNYPVPPSVADTVGGATAVTALAMPTGALAARRLSLLMALGSCSSLEDLPTQDSVLTAALDATSSPTTLLIGPDVGGPHRGAVIGNISLWGGGAVIAFLLTLLVRAVQRNRERSSMERSALPDGGDRHRGTVVESAAFLRLPGLFFIVVTLLLQQVVGSSTLLLIYPTPSWEAADRVIAVFGLCIAFAVIVATVRVLHPSGARFRAVAVASDPNELKHFHSILFPPRRHPSASQRSSWWRGRPVVLKWAVYLAACIRQEKVCWTSKRGDALFVERYGFLFEGCNRHRHWWIVVELCTTVVLSVLSAIIPQTITTCLALVWFSVSVALLYLVITVFFRPMNSLLENCIVYALAFVQAVVALCSALAAPPAVSYALSISATVLSALLVAAALVHVLGTRLRGVSGALRHHRRQFILGATQQKNIVARAKGTARTAQLRVPTLDISAVLPPPGTLDLATLIQWICDRNAGQLDEEARRGITILPASETDASRSVGPVGTPKRALTVRFAGSPGGARPRRRLLVPELPSTLAVQFNREHEVRGDLTQNAHSI